jgi:hypothetical protein
VGAAARRHRRAGVFAVAALLVNALVPGAHAVGPTAIAAVDAMIDAPRVLFGETPGEIERALGAPTSRRTVRDVEELVYPGIVLRVHRGTRLASILITDPRYALPGGLRVGALRSDVERALGEAQQSSDDACLYLYSDGFPKTVRFQFADGRVRRIEWSYWTE